MIGEESGDVVVFALSYNDFELDHDADDLGCHVYHLGASFSESAVCQPITIQMII